MLDPDHPLVKLAGLIDWSRSMKGVRAVHTPLKGRPACDETDWPACTCSSPMEACPTSGLRALGREPVLAVFLRLEHFRHKMVYRGGCISTADEIAAPSRTRPEWGRPDLVHRGKEFER